MKTIKIFLASSEELDYDRMAFGNLVRRLDDMYEKRGIRIKLFEWEDYDSAYNDKRKQDEYNDYVRQSDIFLALFHKKAGQFTVEEFDVASQEFKDHASPKVYTYCKDLKPGEEESKELKEFKERLFNEMGHYWCRYDNRESLQFQFVMQLQLVESNRMDDVKVEDGIVTINGLPVAKMENLKFAAGNKAYQKMSAELVSLPEKIEKARLRVAKFPDDEDLIEDLQQKLNHYNKLKEEFSQLQNALFETAQRITSMQLEQVSDILHRAIEAFEEGNLERANTLLDEIAHEAEHHMAQLESDRTLVHKDIDAFLLQAKTVMADASIPIDERINKTAAIYAKADEWAQKSALPNEKYESLLNNYGLFLYEHALYEKALLVCQHLITLREVLYGNEHANIAESYDNIGLIYSNLGNNQKALEFHRKALVINEKVFGQEHSSTAFSYNNIGLVYYGLGDYDRALAYFSKAMSIREKILGLEHPDTAISSNCIGEVYRNLCNYEEAMKYCAKALAIREKIFGLEHPYTANSYNNIGLIYYNLGNYDKALIYYSKTLAIREKVLGLKHPNTARTYNNIGLVYSYLKNYEKAINYYFKALGIIEIIIGIEHPTTTTLYDNIGCAFYNLGDYNKAFEYCSKALAISKKVFGLEHPCTKTIQDNIEVVKQKMG